MADSRTTADSRSTGDTKTIREGSSNDVPKSDPRSDATISIGRGRSEGGRTLRDASTVEIIELENQHRSIKRLAELKSEECEIYKLLDRRLGRSISQSKAVSPKPSTLKAKVSTVDATKPPPRSPTPPPSKLEPICKPTPRAPSPTPKAAAKPTPKAASVVIKPTPIIKSPQPRPRSARASPARTGTRPRSRSPTPTRRSLARRPISHSSLPPPPKVIVERIIHRPLLPRPKYPLRKYVPLVYAGGLWSIFCLHTISMTRPPLPA